MSDQNKLIVLIMGKSGCGKSTLERNMIELFPQRFKKVVSTTTRPIREGEEHGKDYYFVTDEEYDNTDFIQVTEFAGYRYGSAVSEYQTNHQYPILCVVPDSAVDFTQTLSERFSDWGTFNIYFDISDEALMNNMRKRGDTEEMIEKRVSQDTLDEQFNSSGLVPHFLIYDRDLSDNPEKRKEMAGAAAMEAGFAKMRLDTRNLAKINWNY